MLFRRLTGTWRDQDKLWYCLYIKDTAKIYLTLSDELKCLYCLYKCDREEVWRSITNDKDKLDYCILVHDRPEVYNTITSNEYKKKLKEYHAWLNKSREGNNK